MAGIEVAEEFVAAFGAKDQDRMEAALAEDVVLDGPFPIGKKKGPAKSASAILNVGKLGVKLGEPQADGEVIRSAIQSPAGAMVLQFTVEGGRITRLDVEKP